MTITLGLTASKNYLFDGAGIAAFAAYACDDNPLHHDAAAAAAAASRFGSVIASGAQMSAVLMGVGASLLSQGREAAGLQFSFRFLKAIPAGTHTTLRCWVTAAEPNAKLGGQLASICGHITGADGTVHVTCTGTAVIWDKRAGSE